MTITLRPMRWWDIPAVHDLDVRSFPASSWSVEMFWSELAGVPESRYYVVAERGDPPTLVGYAGLLATPPDADVQTIAVEPRERRSGLGQRLVTALLDEAARRGCTRTMLEVAADNVGAQKLYERLGFSVIARRSNYYGNGRDALIMQIAHAHNTSATRATS